MLSFKTPRSTLSIRTAAAHPSARLRRWGAQVSTSLLLLACGGPAQLDLGSDESALENPADGDGAGTSPTVDPTTGEVTPPIAGGTEPAGSSTGTGSAEYGPCVAAGTQDPTTGAWPAGGEPATAEPVAGTEPAGSGTGTGVAPTKAADPITGAGEPSAGTEPAPIGSSTAGGESGVPATAPAPAGSSAGGGTYYPPCPAPGTSSPTPSAWPSGNEPPALDPSTGAPAVPTTEPSAGGQPAPTTEPSSGGQPAPTTEPSAGGQPAPTTEPSSGGQPAPETSATTPTRARTR